MKKILVLLFVLVFNACVCVADYKPIPAEQSKQYKAEIEQIINLEVPKAKKELEKETKYATDLYNQIVKNNLDNSSQEYINMTLTQEIVIPFVLVPVYYKVIKATAVYSPSIKTEFGTDDYMPLEEEIMPYLKANNINTQKIDELKELVGDSYQQIQGYANNVRKIKE